MLYLPKPVGRDISLDTAVSAQNLVVLDIAMLAGHIDKFADWWGRMEVTMKGAEIGANKIDSEEDKLQRENMAMLWAEIINGYKLYNVQVSLCTLLQIGDLSSQSTGHSTTGLLYATRSLSMDSTSQTRHLNSFQLRWPPRSPRACYKYGVLCSGREHFQ